MLENLMNIVNELSQKTVAGNAGIPSDKKEAVAQTLSESLISGLQNQASQGNIKDLFDIFSKKETSAGNPAMNGIQSAVIDMISSKVGVSGGTVSSLIPVVLNMLSKKAGDSNDNSLDFNGLFNMISGGKTSGVDMNSAMSRLDDDNDGFGLDDVASMLGGGGGIMGTLKNLLGGK